MKGNFKVRCTSINGNSFYTAGKVYEIKNGTLTADDGDMLFDGELDTIDDLIRLSDSSWELVKEYYGEYISIKRCKKGKRVVAVMSMDGVFQKSANVKLKDFDGDFAKAAKAAVDKLLSLDGKGIEKVVMADQSFRIVKQDKYETGDKVKVREDISKHVSFGALRVTNEMQRMGGKILTIKEASDYPWGRRYFVKESGYSWSADCFEGKIIENTVKEVKRLAKAGEWIKIVNPLYNGYVTPSDYVKNDIFRVSERLSYETVTAGSLNRKPINDREYVVLEGYVPEDKPEVKEVKRPAKVGEWIKVVDYEGKDGFNGVIGKVEKVNGDYITIHHDKIVWRKDSDRDGETTGFGTSNHSKYVVLENYQPKKVRK